MLNKMRKVLKSEKGFTLIELITVIVILGVILGIGLPKYAKMQAQSEWDSDVTTLRNLEKAAEVYYASNVSSNNPVLLTDIASAGFFDSGVILKRAKASSGNTSERNTTKKKLSDLDVTATDVQIYAGSGSVQFTDTAPADGVNDWINNLIGIRP